MITPRVDMYLNEDWVPLPSTEDEFNGIRQKPPIKITAGSKSEDNRASPSKCRFTMNDRDGYWNRKNPMGPYFGSIGKNTPVRVRVPLVTDDDPQTVSNGWGTAGTGYVWVNGLSSGGVIANTDWTRSGTVMSHAVPDSATRRSVLTGTEEFVDGVITFTRNVPIVNVSGSAGWSTWVHVRAVDDDNFIAAVISTEADESMSVRIVERIAGSDRNLTKETVLPGLSNLDAQTWWMSVLAEGFVIRVKVWADGTPEPLDWDVSCERATHREGRFDIRSRTHAGNSNSKPIVFSYDNLVIEAAPFTGEATEFNPAVGDESHAARSMQIVASGILQRQEQGSEPLKSTLFRKLSSDAFWVRVGGITATSGTTTSIVGTDADAADIADVGGFGYLLDSRGFILEETLFEIIGKNSAAGSTTVTFQPAAINLVVATDQMITFRLAGVNDRPIVYWPCEDGQNSTQVASGLPGGDPLIPRFTMPRFAVDDSLAGSGPLLQLNNAELFDVLPDYTNTGELTLHFVARFPDVDEAATNQDIISFYTSAPGGNVLWELAYEAGGGTGDIRVRVTNVDGTLLASTPYDMGMRGQTREVFFTLVQTAPTVVQYRLVTVEFAGEAALSAALTPSTTVVGLATLGKVNRLTVNPLGGYVDVSMGHIAVFPIRLDYFNLSIEAQGYFNDWPSNRMARLAYEEGVPLIYCQSVKQPTRMILGVQRNDTLMANLQAVAEVNMGRFYESRGAYSFEYRTLESLYNQWPLFDVDYLGGAVLAEFVPTDDDQATRNDITVARDKGSKARVQELEGPMSVNRFPAGVGRYTAAPTVMAGRDAHLERIAAWRVHVGTVDEFRYPSIRLTSATGVIPLHRLLSAGIGHRFVMTNASISSARTYEPIDQLINGYELELHPIRPVLELNCVPATPYDIAEFDDDATRLDSDASFTNEAVDTTEVAIDVRTDDPTTWVTTAAFPAEFPFDVLLSNAERVTVTAITGATSPQVFTVVRSVNGVVMEHLNGATVRLADPVYLAP